MRDIPSQTAAWVAWLRTLEGARRDPVLVDDEARMFLPLPLRIAPDVGRLARRIRGVTGLTGYIVGRHAWMDERLERFLELPGEVLILGAGYDTRALRIGRARYWEVDHPATAARKRRRAPRYPAMRVDVDFQQHDLAERLRDAGFPTGARIFVVWEGVTMYLSRAAFRQTLAHLADLCGPGSELVLDALAPPGRTVQGALHRASTATMPLIGEPITLQLAMPAMARELDAQGWRVTGQLDAAALSARIGGRRVLPAATVHHATLRG
jgi:methyltransferase (TIGR00027 family)